MSDTLTADVDSSMLAPLTSVEPVSPSPATTATRSTVNDAAKRGVSSAAIGIANVYKILRTNIKQSTISA